MFFHFTFQTDIIASKVANFCQRKVYSNVKCTVELFYYLLSKCQARINMNIKECNAQKCALSDNHQTNVHTLTQNINTLCRISTVRRNVSIILIGTLISTLVNTYLDNFTAKQVSRSSCRKRDTKHTPDSQAKHTHTHTDTHMPLIIH